MAIEVTWYESLLDQTSLTNESCGVGSNQIHYPNTMGDLRQIATSACLKMAFLRGYAAAGDGGGGEYYWSKNSTGTDNDNSIIEPNDQPPAGRWHKLL